MPHIKLWNPHYSLSSDEVYEGLVVEILENSLPVISIQHELLALKESFTKVDGGFISGQSMLAIVNGVQSSNSTLAVMFLGGQCRNIKVKDLNTVSNYSKIYKPGNVIRVAVNKLGRLCTKEKVINACSKDSASDQNT